MQSSNSFISLSFAKQLLVWWWEASDLAVTILPSGESAFLSCDCLSPFTVEKTSRFLAFLYSFDLLDLSGCLVDVYFL